MQSLKYDDFYQVLRDVLNDKTDKEAIKRLLCRLETLPDVKATKDIVSQQGFCTFPLILSCANCPHFCKDVDDFASSDIYRRQKRASHIKEKAESWLKERGL